MKARALALITLAATGVACSAGNDAGGRASSSGSDSMPSFVTPGAPGATKAEPGARAASADSTAPAPRPRAFDLCALLPTDTVAHVLRSTIGKSVSTASRRAGGLCTYRDPATGAPRVRVIIDVGRDRSASAAGVSFLSVRDQLGARGIQTTDVPGLADQAFGTSDSTGSYAVFMRHDVLTMRVNVVVRDANATSLRPAAVELSRRLLAILQ